MLRKVLATALVLQVAFLAACSALPYQDDNKGFLVSAQAGSTEFPVYVNGHLCTDMEGNAGLCAKRIKSTEDLTFHFDPQPYPIYLEFSCTAGISGVTNHNWPAGQSYSFTLSHADIGSFTQFTCNGKVNPQDRPEPIAAAFQVRVVVYDSAYALREAIHVEQAENDLGAKENWLILGQFARDSWVYDDGSWQLHKKETMVKLEGDPAQAKAYSGSYLMRFNYLNMGDADAGVK